MVNKVNKFRIEGNIERLHEFCNGKAMNVVVAVHSENRSTYVNLKCFNPNVFKYLRKNMLVRVEGHIGKNCYVDKNGNTQYMSNNDLIADYIQFDVPKIIYNVRTVSVS